MARAKRLAAEAAAQSRPISVSTNIPAEAGGSAIVATTLPNTPLVGLDQGRPGLPQTSLMTPATGLVTMGAPFNTTTFNNRSAPPAAEPRYFGFGESGDAGGFGGQSSFFDGPQEAEAGETRSTDWATERAELVRRLRDIKTEFGHLALFVEKMEAARHQRGIGDNHPPEPIEALPLGVALLSEGGDAADVLQAELGSENPRSNVIRLCFRVLSRVSTGVADLLQWLEGKGELYIDEVLKSAGAETGKILVRGTAAWIFCHKFHDDLSAIIGHINHLYHFLP